MLRLLNNVVVINNNASHVVEATARSIPLVGETAMDYLDSETVTYLSAEQEHLFTIYKTTNLVNGKCYIGFDSNWPRRHAGHLYASFNKKYVDYSNYFHRAIRKYGKENFKWEILYQDTNDYFTLNVMEPFFIERYRSFIDYDDCNGYNMTSGGDSGTKKSIETINKINKNPEKIRKMAESHRGMKRSTEAKKKMSESAKLRCSRIGSPMKKGGTWAANGRIWYHHPVSLEKYFGHEGTQPPEYIKGRRPQNEDTVLTYQARINRELGIKPVRNPVKFYEITNDKDETFIVDNLKKFCDERGLSACTLGLICRGVRNTTHRGYRGKKIEKNNV